MQRLHVEVKGIVQGVGFRPFVYNLATKNNLVGWVLNDARGVELEIEGPTSKIESFLVELRYKAPPLAVINEIKIEYIKFQGDKNFIIRQSVESIAKAVLISPDVSICDDCAKELQDVKDRRYRYPFINCTNCGPRYTIIEDVPYDRIATTMKKFIMCTNCQGEYEDPSNRRFHAQPNACENCGPRYDIYDNLGKKIVVKDIILKVRELLRAGKIVAFKGVGGYHLMCDAKNEMAVETLRSRKFREDKPLAIMCASLDAAKEVALINEAEAKLLTSMAKPIVLLEKSLDYNLGAKVAPDNKYIGIMLPYAPIHILLLEENDMLVMTSGNISDEPIVYDDDDAFERLKNIADYFFTHNRPIYKRADDSVTRVFKDKPYFIRRSRGYVPAPIILKDALPPILACGGELKNTFALSKDNKVFLGPHIGDLENLPIYSSYVEAITHFKKLFDIEPIVIAYDSHPEYLSTKYALEQKLPKIAVQHHHAHIASVMAEHRLTEPVIGVAFDGTGYGDDQKLWGGEFFVATLKDYQRVGHVSYMKLPGGAKAIKEPWRLAIWMLYEIYGDNLKNLNIPFIRTLPKEWQLVVEAAKLNLNTPLTSGAGRLFDIAAALLNIRTSVNYEGQGAVELELTSYDALGEVLPYEITEKLELNFKPTFRYIVEALIKDMPIAYLAASFHLTIAHALSETVLKISKQTGLKKVVLSGGVFQNIRLLTAVYKNLEAHKIEIYINRFVPPNDGGLALGQLVIAKAKGGF